jgi:hypothetical protein
MLLPFSTPAFAVATTRTSSLSRSRRSGAPYAVVSVAPSGALLRSRCGRLLAGDISVLAMIAGGAWLTVAIAAAVALHHARAGRTVIVLACVSTVFTMHVAPAAIGLLALTAAVAIRERQRSPQPAGSAEATSPPNPPSMDIADGDSRRLSPRP